MGRVRGLLAGCLLLALAGTALPASGAPLYAATYVVLAAPASIGSGQSVAIQVSLTNTGTATWNAGGAQPVQLSYHWYDPTGRAVVWDGVRTALGADVAAGASRTLDAQVVAPPGSGPFLLRFALVKEGLTWFEPEATAHGITVVAAFAASYGPVALPRFVAGATATVSVSLTNVGSATWLASGTNPVSLSYHWYDASGRAVIWDGARTALGGDVAPGSARTLAATVPAPPAAGTYTLVFDLVREGIAWLSTTLTQPATVEAATYRASYGVGATAAALMGESRTIPVTVTNTGNVAWNAGGPQPVHLSSHWYDAAGNPVIWDGPRTALATDLAPAASQTVPLLVVVPARIGAHTLAIDLVKEGVAWFSALGTPPAAVGFQVASGFNVGYGADTTPATITVGGGFPVSIQLTNTGQRPWPATGPNPVTLSYHVYDASGDVVLWDGMRATLGGDVAPGATVTVNLVAVAPRSIGTYSFVLDLVQEGVGWFSQLGVPATKSKTLSVFPGVTLYGKGWGHGLGLSQWGAQGWASGATGTALTGEQIALRYYPGAVISQLPANLSFRVLLSAPATGCVGQTIYSTAQMRSDGGIAVLNEAAGRAVILRAAPTQTVRVWVEGTTLKVMDEWSAQVIYSGATPIILTSVDPAKATTIVQKSRFYKGDLRFEVQGPGQLRVVNWVNPDDYARGVVPAEMLTGWHVEAYKAQAYAARSFAAWKQSTNAATPYDVRDDVADQCYGGASVETTATNLAVAATAGKILTYRGAPIRAYYASSDGGATDGDGCLWNAVRTPAGGYACGTSEPYLVAVPDPADLAAAGPSGPNPHRSWTRTFTSAQIESAVARAGYYIGAFVSMDLSNTAPGGHVISVRIVGTAGSVELRGDDFLRTRLGVRSTMARTYPF